MPPSQQTFGINANASSYKGLLSTGCWDFMSKHFINLELPSMFAIRPTLSSSRAGAMAVLTLAPSLTQCLVQSRCFVDICAGANGLK